MIDGLLYGYGRNLEYLERLCADLDDTSAARQAAPGMNHPLWVLSHLNNYHTVIAGVALGETFPDPKNAPFGMGSIPENPASPYKPLATLLADFRAGHQLVEKTLRAQDQSIWKRPVTLERWQQNMPTAEKALPYLMLVHENQHLGQLSAWRRALGLPSV